MHILIYTYTCIYIHGPLQSCDMLTHRVRDIESVEYKLWRMRFVQHTICTRREDISSHTASHCNTLLVRCSVQHIELTKYEECKHTEFAETQTLKAVSDGIIILQTHTHTHTNTHTNTHTHTHTHTHTMHQYHTQKLMCVRVFQHNRITKISQNCVSISTIFTSEYSMHEISTSAEASNRSAQGWRIGYEPLICSKMCFTKTELVQ